MNPKRKKLKLDEMVMSEEEVIRFILEKGTHIQVQTLFGTEVDLAGVNGVALPRGVKFIFIILR